jgi:hypothetical protein
MTDLTDTQVVEDTTRHLPLGQDPDIRWLLVSGEEDYVKAYLYESARIVSHNPGEGYGPVSLVVVCGRPGRGDADYYANYQADRLRSGLIQVSVHPTYHLAYEAALAVHRGDLYQEQA